MELSEKGQAVRHQNHYLRKMTEERGTDITNFTNERDGFLPTPDKTIPPEIDDRAAKVTALNMLQVINRIPTIEVGRFQTDAPQG